MYWALEYRILYTYIYLSLGVFNTGIQDTVYICLDVLSTGIPDTEYTLPYLTLHTELIIKDENEDFDSGNVNPHTKMNKNNLILLFINIFAISLQYLLTNIYKS